jgi:hypothetical protein
MYAHSRCGWTCDVRGQPVGSPAGFRWDARVASSLPTLMEIIIARARAAVPMSRGILLLPRARPTDCLGPAGNDRGGEIRLTTIAVCKSKNGLN